MICFSFMFFLLVELVLMFGLLVFCVGCWVLWWVIVFVVMWLLFGVVEGVLVFGVLYVVVCMV